MCQASRYKRIHITAHFRIITPFIKFEEVMYVITPFPILGSNILKFGPNQPVQSVELGIG